MESRVLPRLASNDRLRVLVIHEWVTTVEDQANNTQQCKLRDVLNKRDKNRLTIKQAQLNSRIPPIQFGGFSVYLFRRFAPLQNKEITQIPKSMSKKFSILCTFKGISQVYKGYKKCTG